MTMLTAFLIADLLAGKAALYLGERDSPAGWYWLAVTSGSYLVAAALAQLMASRGLAGLFMFMAGFWGFLAWHDWKRRPPRKRKRKAAGARARALLAKLKRNMPRVRVPQLKPVPA